ncbi:MAG: metallophosphoesterase, partial [Planctomycetales bacterium]|nr:metallophosphoesterase [Planctomycetales bacterium]
MKAALLVLSDIHIASATDPILSTPSLIARACYATLPLVDALVILVAGDVAFSGKSDQYDLALKFLREIGAQLKAEREVPISFVVVPGNHDCDFEKDSPMRQALIDSVLRGSTADLQIVEQCTGVQGAFFEFRDALEGKQAQKNLYDRLWRVVRIPVGSEVITVEAINMAWLSKLNETVGCLTFPWQDVAPAVDGSAAGVRIAIQHHPANWMSQHTYRPYRAFLKQRSHLVITGHEHVPNVGLIIDTEAASTTFAECGPLQEGNSLEQSSFVLLTIDTAEERMTARSISFDGEKYVPIQDEPWEYDRALTLAAEAPFVLRPAFERLLNDPGAPIRDVNGNTIELVDFFVHPDMIDLVADGKSGTVSLTSSRELGNPEFIRSGVFLVGESKSG